MTVGYRISGGTDLDLVFKARTSAAAANTGFRDSSAVDLSNRFEPRGATVARANTGFRISGGTDFAQVFMDINTAPTLLTLTLTAGLSGSKVGYRNTASGYAAIGSISGTPEWTIGGQAFRLEECNANNGLAGDFLIRVSHATITVPDTDACWTFIKLTGTFATSGTGTRTILRSARYSTNTGTTPGPVRQQRNWQHSTSPSAEMVSGNSYTFELG